MENLHLLNKYLGGSITRKLNAELKIQLKELNVNVTEGNLLLFISEHPGLLQKEVAQGGMFLDPGMITRDLQYLEARGGDLVKAASPNSSRGKSIAVTTAGEAKAQKSNGLWMLGGKVCYSIFPKNRWKVLRNGWKNFTNFFRVIKKIILLVNFSFYIKNY